MAVQEAAVNIVQDQVTNVQVECADEAKVDEVTVQEEIADRAAANDKSVDEIEAPVKLFETSLGIE